MEHNHSAMRTYVAIMAERDAAIQERNMALEERKRAFAERDMAMLQRDAAIAERNSAIQERDEAIAAIRFQDSSMNDNNMNPDSLENGIVFGAKHIYDQQHMSHMSYLAEAAYSPREIPTSKAIEITGVASEAAKPKKFKQTTGTKAISVKSAKSPRMGKEGAEGLSKQAIIATSTGWENGQDFGGNEELDRPLVVWEDALGLNQVNFDESSMPAPVCTCTGVPQPCYRWGNGGWQSACCTTTMSMYPLPQVSNKRYSRVGGRKMSGSAFTKLLNRLAAEGQDLSTPLDLKDHWAKHGTNRYSTLK